jgi:general secretion pathway protein F
MPEYRYRAVDDKGRDTSGAMNEDSAVRVTAILEEQGLQVSSVDPVALATDEHRRKGSLTWDEVDLLNQQLFAIVRSGLPLAPALKAVATELRTPRLKALLDSLHTSLEQGRSLEQALDAQAEKLPPVYRASLIAGERAGNLSAVLEHMCAYTGHMVETKNRVQVAIAYPILVVVMCICVLAFLLTYVVPQFAEIFQDFGAGLPWPTRFWIDVADTVRFRYPGIMIAFSAVVIAGYFGLKYLRSTPRGRFGLDRIKLRLPAVGRVFRLGSFARFCRTLGVLLTARAPLIESMRLAAAASGNAVLARAVSEAARNVEQGSSIAGAFESTGYFDGTFGWLLGLAEERGELEGALLHLADTYDQTGQRSSRVLISVLPPVLIFLLGGIVVSIVVSIYLPIFTLADVISGQ